MRLLNKIYGLVQAARCFLNIFCDDTFEQLETDRRVFHKFDDRKREMVMVVHMDDVLVHAQATVERFAAELGGKV